MNLFPASFYEFSGMPDATTKNQLGNFPSDGFFTQEQIAAEFFNAQQRWIEQQAIMAQTDPLELARQSAERAIAAQESMNLYLQNNAAALAQVQSEIDALGAQEAALLAAQRAAIQEAENAAQRASALAMQAEREAAAIAAAEAAASQQAAIDAANFARQRQIEEQQKADQAAALAWFEADMFANATAAQKAAAYLAYSDLGKTDAEIRSAAETFFGKQRDEDWQLLQQMARQIAIDRARPTRPPGTPRPELVIPELAKEPAGNAGAIALAALAAALLIGA